MKISGNFLMIIVILAGIASLQFMKGRKLNVALMKVLSNGFEKKLKIKDQLYTWIGGYIGFKANYDLSDKYIKKVEMTLTLLPRQSLFYLPISILVKKGDRLFIVLRPRFEIKRDAHIIKSFYYLFGPAIEEKHELKKGSVEIEDRKGFYTLYEEESDIDKLRKLVVECFSDVRRVRHITVVKSTNVLFCLIKPDPNKTPEEIRKLVEYFPKIFYEKEELRDFQ